MSYCTITDMTRILPEKISIGDSNIGVPIPGRPGNQGAKRSSLTPENAKKYIGFAQSYIDSRLRPFYLVPLRQIKTYETDSLTNINAGTNVEVMVDNTGAFSDNDTIRLQTKNAMETVTLKSVQSSTVMVLTSVSGNYNVSDGLKLSIIKYPDPITLITARFSTAIFLDTLFVAEQSPDVSGYAKSLRNLARDEFENILTGEVFLVGQEWTGRRFVRAPLLDAYKSPAEIATGQDKE
jgi:hypothetical protein